MKNLIKLSVLFISIVLSFPVSAEEPAAKLDRQQCALCHGPGGNTTSEQFPRLAGEPAVYFINQMKAFRDKTRADQNAQRFMWGIASRLTDEQIEQLGSYYEAKAPIYKNKVTDQKKYDQGMVLFTNGNQDKSVPACAACHGDKAQGNGAMPRLAGQHEEYLKKQLKVFYGNDRPSAVAMHEIVKGLSDSDINALAQYLQAQ